MHEQHQLQQHLMSQIPSVPTSWLIVAATSDRGLRDTGRNSWWQPAGYPSTCNKSVLHSSSISHAAGLEDVPARHPASLDGVELVICALCQGLTKLPAILLVKVEAGCVLC